MTDDLPPCGDASAETPERLYISCGCIWNGPERIRVCPAHNRH